MVDGGGDRGGGGKKVGLKWRLIAHQEKQARVLQGRKSPPDISVQLLGGSPLSGESGRGSTAG